MRAFFVFVSLLVLYCSGFATIADAVIIYTYDFPGNPGSGLAVSQTNLQPANGTFGDFTRVNVIAAGGTDIFGSSSWNTTGIIDSTEYEGFSITTSAGYHLELTDLAFEVRTSASGVGNGRVALFINGSATAAATFDYSPTVTLTAHSFDFTDLTAADNATSVEFRFYGWNAGGNGSQLFLDNVATSGVITNVPEFEPAWVASVVIVLSLFFEHRRGKRRGKRRPAPSENFALHN
ncbi:MAG TPA: hypothetical protein VJ719_07375 [Chthoniobacterales bacterium]|nr:hypothetical protein [Chthoniobacterales bacterium]